MASMARLDLSVPVSEATLQGWLRLNASTVSTRQPESVHRIGSYFEAIAGGPFAGSVKVTTGAVQSTATITSTGSASNGETMSIANVTFTAETSGAVGNQFNISGTPTTQAANMVAAINASPNLAGIVTASNVAGVVTLTAVAPGTLGNGFQLSEALTNVTATQFTGGVDGTVVTVSNGY